MGDSWVIPSSTSLTERSVCHFWPSKRYLSFYQACRWLLPQKEVFPFDATESLTSFYHSYFLINEQNGINEVSVSY